MDIQFNQVLPKPLSSVSHDEKSLWNSNLVLTKGTRVVVEAPSGRGKSTLIHLLYGIRQDYEGQILFDEKSIVGLSKNNWSNYRTNMISIVFQDLQLFPKLSVLENLILKNSLTNHLSLEEIHRLISLVGLETKVNESCGNLSMGQQQRIAIIRALCQPFAWLLLDEPFSHLEAENATICMDLINKHCEGKSAGWILTSLGTHVTSSYDQLILI